MKKAFMALLLFLAIFLAGCDGQTREIAYERQARHEALKREAAARQLAEREQSRREFWQIAAYSAGALAVLLLVVGTAIGSRCRDAAAKP